MTYYQEIQEQLENGQMIMNDADDNFTWVSFTKRGFTQVHIYTKTDLIIRNYKNMKSLAVAVGRLLNGSY